MASRANTGHTGWPAQGGAFTRNVTKPGSSCSSDDSGTLHGDDNSSNVRGRSESTHVTSGDESPDDDLAALTRSRFFSRGAKFFEDKSSLSDTGFTTSDSEQRVLKAPIGPSRPFKSRNANNSYNSGGGGGGGGGGYRSSKTWVSPDAQHMQEFLIIRNAMRRLFKHSDVAKWKYQDYIAHREASIASQKAALSKSVEQKESERELQPPHMDSKAMSSFVKLLPGKQNFGMQGNVGRVLGEKTIWCMDWLNGKEEISPWPSHAEMKWEGDDRAKTGVGRFLPLPREPGAPGIPWNQLQVVDQYPMDQIACIPTMEDVYLPVDEIDEADKYKFISKMLEEAMDEYLDS